MAVNINSPEFANAWRIVSEAILASLQNGGSIEIPPIHINETENHQQKDTKEAPIISEEKAKEVSEIRYANCPIKQLDGSYLLKNLKDEPQTESTYKLTIYTDGTCIFELCNLKGEARQIFKDNQSDRMPSGVGKSIGELTADGSITTIKAGKGIRNGRSVRITEPLEVEFK